MNVGGSVISGAVIEATGVTRQRLSSMYKELGDLGDVAQACRHNQVLFLDNNCFECVELQCLLRKQGFSAGYVSCLLGSRHVTMLRLMGLPATFRCCRPFEKPFLQVM